MAASKEEMKVAIYNAIEEIRSNPDWDRGELASMLVEVVDEYEVTDIWYTPSTTLLNRINDYNIWNETRKGENAGHLMEELALLTLRSLICKPNVEAYESYDVQHDLIVSSDRNSWLSFLQYIGVSQDAEIIVVEAKNTNDPVDVKQFEFLCSVIQNKFSDHCKVAIFFSRSGASGFPKKNAETQKRCLRYAWATQILFHAKTGKYVIVFDHEDLQVLTERGAFPKLLRYKIQEVEKATGVDRFDVAQGTMLAKTLLGYHLQKHIDNGN